MKRYLRLFLQSAIATFAMAFVILNLSSQIEIAYACHNGTPHGQETSCPSSTPSTSPSPNPGNGHTPTVVCHAVPAAENEPTNNYETITIDDDGGDGNVNLQGHQNHAKDVINPNQGICPVINNSSSPTPTPTPTATPTSTPTATVTPSPTPTLSPAEPPSGGGTSGGQVLDTSTSTSSGQVLGASTTAKAGTAEDLIGLLLVFSGTILVGTSLNAYRKVYA